MLPSTSGNPTHRPVHPGIGATTGPWAGWTREHPTTSRQTATRERDRDRDDDGDLVVDGGGGPFVRSGVAPEALRETDDGNQRLLLDGVGLLLAVATDAFGSVLDVNCRYEAVSGRIPAWYPLPRAESSYLVRTATARL